MSNFYHWNEFVKAVKIHEFNYHREEAKKLFAETYRKKAISLLKAYPEFDDMFRRNHPDHIPSLNRIIRLDHIIKLN
jgi:hypothetical protein